MDTLINYISIGLGLILAIIGIILQIRSNKKKEPVYSIKSVNVISDFSSKYQDLAVSYKNREIKNFTVSKILFYNRGAETITLQDIDTVNHLRIEVRFFDDDRFDLLDVSVLQFNNYSNQFSVTLNTEKDYWALVEFDYLDKNQGAIIQVIHTGLSSDDIHVVGDIKGVQKLEQVLPDILEKMKPVGPWQARDKIFLGVSTLIALMFWGFIFSPSDYLNVLLHSINPFAAVLVFAGLIIGLMATVVPLAILTAFIIRLSRGSKIIPKGLEKFFE